MKRVDLLALHLQKALLEIEQLRADVDRLMREKYAVTDSKLVLRMSRKREPKPPATPMLPPLVDAIAAARTVPAGDVPVRRNHEWSGAAGVSTAILRGARGRR